VNNL
jgi:hypothetical protein